MPTTRPSCRVLSAETELQELIAAARAGSEEALGELLDMYRDWLRLVAAFRLPQQLRPNFDPSDVVQQASLDVFRSLAQFNGRSRAELLAWMRRIVQDNVTDAVRQHRQTGKQETGREVALPDSEWLIGRPDGRPRRCDTPSEEYRRQETAEQLHQAIEALPEDYRAVVEMHHGDGVAFAEIALRMNRSVDAVRKLWSRALSRLGQTLGRKHGPGQREGREQPT